MQFEPKEPIFGLNPHVSITDTEESAFGVHQNQSFHFDFLHKEYNCICLIQNHTWSQTNVQQFGTIRAFTDTQLQ